MSDLTPDKNTYCVYCHTNKINGKQYVGITRKAPEKRWQNGTRYSHNSHFYAAIKKYGRDGFNHEVLHVGLSHDEACTLEKQYIKTWNLQNKRYGYNLTNGGEGYSGRVLSEETRAKISEAHKKPAFMFDKDGHFIKEFPSAIEGSVYVGLKSCQYINKCCNGQRKLFGGYIWRYKQV